MLSIYELSILLSKYILYYPSVQNPCPPYRRPALITNQRLRLLVLVVNPILLHLLPAHRTATLGHPTPVALNKPVKPLPQSQRTGLIQRPQVDFRLAAAHSTLATDGLVTVSAKSSRIMGSLRMTLSLLFGSWHWTSYLAGGHIRGISPCCGSICGTSDTAGAPVQAAAVSSRYSAAFLHAYGLSFNSPIAILHCSQSNPRI